ncbi:MAG: hypothetical protein ACE5LX_10355 [Nitrospinota bacterium]
MERPPLEELLGSARSLIERFAPPSAGEEVLILSDTELSPLSELFEESLGGLDVRVSRLIFLTRPHPEAEPPRAAAEALAGARLFFALTKHSLSYTLALEQALKGGTRGLLLTDFCEEMLSRGASAEGAMEEGRKLALSVAERLSEAKMAYLSAPAGTGLELSLEGREGIPLTGAAVPGHLTPALVLAATIAPLEGSAQGVIVADGSVGQLGIGLLKEPVISNVRDGLLTGAYGGPQALFLKDALLSHGDPYVFNLAELSVGLNPAASLSGHPLEDGGAMGVVRIGIGTNTLTGGRVRAASHYDLFIRGATLTLDGEAILKEGELQATPL